jgi:threonine/homoserine/homoserine lactone efflux protein
VAWLSQNYMREDRLIAVCAGIIAIAGTVYLLWINYAVWRKLGEMKSLS